MGWTVKEDCSKKNYLKWCLRQGKEQLHSLVGGKHCRDRSSRCKGPGVGGWDRVDGPCPEGRPSWPGPRLTGPAVTVRGLLGSTMEPGLILSAGGGREAGPDPCARETPLVCSGKGRGCVAPEGSEEAGFQADPLGHAVAQEGEFQIYFEGEATGC